MDLFRRITRYIKQTYTMGHFPSLVSLLTNKKRILAYHGFLGDRNFGDELVFTAAKALFHPFVLLPVKSRMPLFTEALFFARILKYRGEILGGGTLIGPSCNLFPASSSTFVHGTGVKPAFTDRWVDTFSNRTVFGGVRGTASEAALAARGMTIGTVGDAAFYYFDVNCPNNKKDGPLVINMGTHNDEAKMQGSRSEFKNFICLMLDRGIAVEFLPMHAQDVKIGQSLKEYFPGIRLHDIPKTFEACRQILNSAAFAIGERLHFGVMAALSNCPFFSIMYGAKHDELLNSLGCIDAGETPHSMTSQSLVEKFDAREGFDWKKIHQNFARYKHLQTLHAKSYVEHLRQAS